MSKLDDIIFTAMTGNKKIPALLPESVASFMAEDEDAQYSKREIKELFLELADSLLSNDYVADERFISWPELKEAIEEL